MKRGLQPFSRESSTNILAKLNGLLPCMAETCRTHGWSSLMKHTVLFSSMGSTLVFEDDEEVKGGRPLKPISISNKNLHLLPFLKDRNISSKGFPCIAETFRTHDWSLLLKYNVPLSSIGNTQEFVDDEEKAVGRHLKPISISDKDLQHPSILKDWVTYYKSKRLLPSLAETFETKDWSLLLKFSSLDSNLNIEDALKSDLVAICVCLLFTEFPLHVKESVARTLAFISFGTSEATEVSTYQAGVENLVVRILSSGNAEVQRQTCFALYNIPFNCSRLAAAFEAGIQDQLIQLACNLHCNPDSTYPVINAVSGIFPYDKVKREKVVKTELLNSWLVKLLCRKDDESIIKETCFTVECIIAFERCDPELWDHVKRKLLPLMVDELHKTVRDVFMAKAVAGVILNITQRGSSDQIDDVVEMGGLKCLLHLCSFEDDDLANTCLNAFKFILRAGEANAKAKTVNKYAMMIDGYNQGWDILLDNMKCKPYLQSTVNKVHTLVWKYRPVYDILEE